MSRRRKSGTDSALELVLWVIVLIPVGAFFLLKLLFRFLKWLFAVIAHFANGRPPTTRGSVQQRMHIGVVDGFDGVAFENFVVDLLRQHGYRQVWTTSASGDYGVDVVASKEDLKYAFQCKRYSSNVGVKAVQEVYAGAKMYHADVAVVVTNSFFTPNAITLSKELGVVLWDRNHLARMLKQPIANERPVMITEADETYSAAERTLIANRKKDLICRLHDLLVYRMVVEQRKEKQPTEETSAHMKKEEDIDVAVLGAGKYVFGKNLPNGMYDIFVLSGEGSLNIYCRDDDELWIRLGSEDRAKEYRGIDSDDVKSFTLDGSVVVRIAKSQMIQIED